MRNPPTRITPAAKAGWIENSDETVILGPPTNDHQILQLVRATFYNPDSATVTITVQIVQNDENGVPEQIIRRRKIDLEQDETLEIGDVILDARDKRLEVLLSANPTTQVEYALDYAIQE